MAHACNPSYLGGGNRKIEVQDHIQKITKEKRAGGVAQGPCFHFPVLQKKKKKKKKKEKRKKDATKYHL
jgi:hypothetical protein